MIKPKRMRTRLTRPSPSTVKVKAYATGLWAESLCRLVLRLKGYRIVASRYRSKLGEIDIVASRGRVLALIEVKARMTHDAALEAVLPRQMQRLQQAGQLFLARHAQYNRHDIRFDIMLVRPWRLPCHLTNAWRP